MHNARSVLIAVIFPLILMLGIIAAGLFQWEIGRVSQTFPPPSIANELAAEKTYGVTADLTLYAEAELTQQLDAMQSAGITWIRQPFLWTDIEPARGQFEWEKLDHAIETARLRGFKIIAVLDTSPAWTHPESTLAKMPPSEVTDFGTFARTAAKRYLGDIDTFQIWHEPNISEGWGGKFVSPENYTLLLKNAALNIRAINPQAKIIAASLAPTLESNALNLNEFDFLQGMYAANAAPYFDILGAQFFGFDDDPQIAGDPNRLNFQRAALLRNVMLSNNDGETPIWATAFGWNALPADWAGQPSPWHSDVLETQVRRMKDGLNFARQNYPWLGVISMTRWDNIGLAKDDPARGFALSPDMLSTFEEFSEASPIVATVGSYPATHVSGQYSAGWQHGAAFVDVAHPSEGELPPTLTIPFEGTRFDLAVNRGDFRGYLWVTIDGLPASALPKADDGRAYVVLNDPLRQPAEVTLARYLPDGNHVAVIEAQGGWGQWAISGWRVFREADTRNAATGRAMGILLALVGAFGTIRFAIFKRKLVRCRVLSMWTWLVFQHARLNSTLQIGLLFSLLAIFYLSPAPMATLVLPIIGLLFLLNLTHGALAIVATLSFFLAKKSIIGATLPVHETLMAMLVFATALRLFLPIPAQLLRDRKLYPIQKLWRLQWLSITDWAVLGLLILGTISTFTAENMGVALYEWRTLIFGASIFYFIVRLLPTLEAFNAQNLAQQLLDALIAGITLHAASALFQYFALPAQSITAEGVHRALGFFYGSPNNLALVLERALPVAGVLLFWGDTGYRRWFYGLSMAIMLPTLFLTFSKGALVLALPATIVFIALMKGGKRAWLGAGSGLILLAISLIPLSKTARFRNIFSLEPGSTAYVRVKVWQSAWSMLKEKPLTGFGLDNFLYQYRTRYILPDAWTEPNLSHPHNFILDFGTRLGIFGIVWIIWAQWIFWTQTLRNYFRPKNQLAQRLLLGIMASMIPFLVHGLIDNAFFLVDLAYIFLLNFAIMELLTNNADY